MTTTRAQEEFVKGLWSLAWLVTLILFLAKLLTQNPVSWWWVVSPLWGLLGLGLVLRVLGMALLGFSRLTETKKQKAARRLCEALENISRRG